VGSAPAWRRLPAQSARSAMVPRPAQVRWPGTAVGWRVGSAHLDRVAGAGEAGAVTRAGVSRDYPAIAGHGLIGDLQTLALVSDRGAVNFFCAPRFDSPSVFASLLDADRGGHFTVTVEGEQVGTTQMYLADSAILVTRFFTPDGVGEVVDFMPVDDPTTPSGEHRIVRVARVVRGTVRFSLQCRPRMNYGATE